MFDTFKAAIRADIEEFVATGKMQQALILTSQTGQHFNHNQYPLYFNGKLDSPIVLIHLNPKHSDTYTDTYTGELWFKTFDQYFVHHQRLGHLLYGRPEAPRHISPFDHKQIRFLKPFGMINFVNEHTREDVLVNLERVLDHKLQLELIPYSSASFTEKGFTNEILRPHLLRVLDVISACPREYVLFCGAVFERLLSDHITDTHRFKLTKNDGQPTQSSVRFSNLCFEYNGRAIHAGLAHSFAQQGIPMPAYGRQCEALYRKEQPEATIKQLA